MRSYLLILDFLKIIHCFICSCKCNVGVFKETLDLYCAQNPDGKLPHPSECSLLYDCTHLMVKPNFPKYVSECKYPYLVDADTAQCRPHDQVECRDRREPISPCKPVLISVMVCLFLCLFEINSYKLVT